MFSRASTTKKRSLHTQTRRGRCVTLRVATGVKIPHTPGMHEQLLQFILMIQAQIMAFRKIKVPHPKKRKPCLCISSNKPALLIFAPHPDDESICATLALRLIREAGFTTFAVPVTLGSDPSLQGKRWREFQAACNILGFVALEPLPCPHGTKLEPNLRKSSPRLWRSVTEKAAEIITQANPALICFPHRQDWHPAHIATHILVTDALKLSQRRAQKVVETEYWHPMKKPNLLVETTPEVASLIMTAIAAHHSQAERNPIHVLFPAWLLENVRRGIELIGGPGFTHPSFFFGTLYRLSSWTGARLRPLLPHPLIVPATQSLKNFLTHLESSS